MCMTDDEYLNDPERLELERDFDHYFNATARLSQENAKLRDKLERVKRYVNRYAGVTGTKEVHEFSKALAAGVCDIIDNDVVTGKDKQ